MNDIAALEELRNMGETDLLNLFHSNKNLDKANAALAAEIARLQAENARLLDTAHQEVRAAYDSTVAQAWREKLATVEAQLAKEHQTAVDLFDVIAEIAQLVGIARSEPELCRKVVTAVRRLVEADESTWESTSEFLRRNEGWLT